MSQQPPLKFSPAQIALWHLVESVIATAIITAGTAAYQAFLTNGFNVTVLSGIAFSSFVGALLRGYTSTVRSNLNFGQAFVDGFAQLQSSINSFVDAHSQAHAQVSQAVAQVQAQQHAAAPMPPPPSVPPVSIPQRPAFVPPVGLPAAPTFPQSVQMPVVGQGQ